MPRRILAPLAALTLAVAALIGCREVEGTGRSQLLLVPESVVNQQGIAAYRDIIDQETVSTDQEMTAIVERVGRRLAAVAPDRGFQWEFTLLESGTPNAFCLPGGKVAIYTGILPYCQTEAGLATVMGHEIAHAIARHGAERMAHQRLVQLGSLAAGLAFSDMDVQTQHMVMGALGVGAQYGVLLPFSRDHESEADYMGLVYTARACFDPTEAPKLWERMGAASGGAPAEFTSTHPSHDTRIRQFSEWMPEAIEIYQQNCPQR